MVFLDFSKAFDTVDHNNLCYKLRNIYGLSSTAVNLVSSYLRDRKQFVSVGDKTSQCLPIARGVPQGSILGPLLFSLYVNELPDIVSRTSIQMYADDVQLHRSCALGMIEDCAYRINKDLEDISNWALLNGLHLNPLKSNILVISKNALSFDYFPSLNLNNIPLVYVSNARNLGVLFNNRLSWDSHINANVGKMYGTLRTLWPSQPFTPLKIRLLLAKSLVLPILTYGCEIFCNCDSLSRRKLNTAFNNVVRYIFGLRRFDHISSYSVQVYKLRFDNFMRFRTLVLFFNVIKSQNPCSLFNRIQFSSSNRTLQIILPRFSCLASERQFFINAIQLWNALPRHMREEENQKQFRKELHIFLQN